MHEEEKSFRLKIYAPQGRGGEGKVTEKEGGGENRGMAESEQRGRETEMQTSLAWTGMHECCLQKSQAELCRKIIYSAGLMPSSSEPRIVEEQEC